MTHMLFLWIPIICAIILAVFVSRKYGYNKKVIWTCLVIGLLCEMEKIAFFVVETEGGFRLPPNHLPFNLCPMQIILLFFLAFSESIEKSRKLIAFMFPTMIAGAFMGMLIPEAIHFHGLAEFATYRYFFYHGMVVFCGFYLYFSKPFEYNIKDYGMTIFLLFCMLIAGIWVNAFFGWDTDVNHMFLVRPSLPNLPVLNLDNGYVVYIRNVILLGFVLISSCYLPVIIRTFRKKQK